MIYSSSSLAVRLIRPKPTLEHLDIPSIRLIMIHSIFGGTDYSVGVRERSSQLFKEEVLKEGNRKVYVLLNDIVSIHILFMSYSCPIHVPCYSTV